MSKKKKPKSKTSLAERMRQKREELKRKASLGFIFKQKEEGTMRVRILPTGEDNDFMYEMVYFWLGNELGSLVSPSSFGEPCALTELYHKLKASKDEADKDLAKKLIPRPMYLVPVLVYKDDKGKKIDTDKSGKLLQIPRSLFQQIIDYYLDEDEWGDMTDPKNGYDLKITREGTGIKDTRYSVQPCKNTPIPKEYAKEIDLEEMVRNQVATYEETLEASTNWLDSAMEEEDDEDKSKKKKKKDKEGKSKKSKEKVAKEDKTKKKKKSSKK